MSEKYTTEEQVKRELGIEKWDELSSNKEKMAKYLEMTPNINRELQAYIISQVPNFLSTASEVSNKALSVLEKKEDRRTEQVKVLNTIVEYLGELGKQESLSDSQRMEVADKLVKVAEIIDKMDERTKREWLDGLKTLGIMAGIALGLGGLFWMVLSKGGGGET